MAIAICYIQSLVDGSDSNSSTFTVDTARIGFNGNSSFYEYIIDLDKEQDYMLAIDQSLKSTGISLVSIDFSFMLIMTILVNNQDDNTRNRYVDDLVDFIEIMLQDVNLKFRTVEQVPPSKYRRVSLKLDQLKGAIDFGLNRIPAIQRLEESCKFSIYPNTWKSTVYDKTDKRKGAFNSKHEISKDIVKLFPNLQIYLNAMYKFSGHDYDGFDSFGLLYHTRIKCFSEEWFLNNVGGKYQLGAISVIFKYLYPDDIQEDFLSFFQAQINSDSLESRNWSEDNSIVENYIVASNTNKLIVMEVFSDKQLSAFLIEYDEEYDEDKTLLVVIGKANKFKLTKTETRYLEKHDFKLKTIYK